MINMMRANYDAEDCARHGLHQHHELVKMTAISVKSVPIQKYILILTLLAMLPVLCTVVRSPVHRTMMALYV